MAGASRTALAAWKRRLRSMLKEQHERQQRRVRSHSDANATNVHGPYSRQHLGSDDLRCCCTTLGKQETLAWRRCLTFEQMRHAAFTDTGS